MHRFKFVPLAQWVSYRRDGKNIMRCLYIHSLRKRCVVKKTFARIGIIYYEKFQDNHFGCFGRYFFHVAGHLAVEICMCVCVRFVFDPLKCSLIIDLSLTMINGIAMSSSIHITVLKNLAASTLSTRWKAKQPCEKQEKFHLLFEELCFTVRWIAMRIWLHFEFIFIHSISQSVGHRKQLNHFGNIT